MVQITHDYTDFNPEGAKVIPDAGHYTLKVLKGEGKTKDQDKGGYSFIEVTFEVIADNNVGQQFPFDYLTGHSNQDTTAKYAMEALGRLYYGATGEKPPRNGFNLDSLIGKFLACEITIKETKPTDPQTGQQRLREDGTPIVYKNANMKGIRPVEAAPAPAQNTAAPQAQATATWG